MSDQIPLTELQEQRNNGKYRILRGELASDKPTERSNLVTKETTENEGYQNDKPLFSYDSDSEGSKGSVASERAYMEDTTTSLQTLMNLTKGFVGTGILALPNAIMHAGIVIGSLGLMLMAVITVHCMHLLVQCSRTLCKRTGKVALSYGEVAEECFRCYNPKTAVVGRFVVDIFLCMTQLGFCCVYFLFVAENLQQVIGGLDTRAWVAILLLPVILFSFIRDLRTITPLSSIANILILVGIIIILQYAARHIPAAERVVEFNGWAGLPMSFGIAMFAFEGIGVVLPLENKMEQPDNFSMVMNVGMGIVTILYGLMGIIGYLFCRESCQGSITLNLPNEPIYSAVKLIFALDIFLTYNVQFYVPMQIIPPPILEKVPQKFQNLAEYGIRAAVVTCTCILAIIVPQLANFVSLVGSFLSTALAILFPTLFHMMLLYSAEGSQRMPPLTLVKDAAILVFGFLGFVSGTYASILHIIVRFEQQAMIPGPGFTNSTAQF